MSKKDWPVSTYKRALTNLIDAVQRYGEERFINEDDERAMELAGARVDKRMNEAQRLFVTKPPEPEPPR